MTNGFWGINLEDLQGRDNVLVPIIFEVYSGAEFHGLDIIRLYKYGFVEKVVKSLKALFRNGAYLKALLEVETQRAGLRANSKTILEA